MSDRTHPDSNQDNLGDFAGKKDDQSSETYKVLSRVDSESRTQEVNWNSASEQDSSSVVSSEDPGNKGMHETTDSIAIEKPWMLVGKKRQEEIHDIVGTSSCIAESVVPSLLPASVIRHTRDGPVNLSSSLKKTTPQFPNEAEDCVEGTTSLNVCFEGTSSLNVCFEGTSSINVCSESTSSSFPSSLPASVIRHTRDEHANLTSLLEKTTPQLPNEAEDCVEGTSSLNVCSEGTSSPVVCVGGHDVEGPSHFICHVCKKCFFFKSYHDRHFITHSREKAFSCSICKQKFTLNCNLKKHMRRHSDPTAHECDQCHRVFARREYLVRHYRLHSGEKPYVCKKCGNRYSDPSYFRKHCQSCGSSSKAD